MENEQYRNIQLNNKSIFIGNEIKSIDLLKLKLDDENLIEYFDDAHYDSICYLKLHEIKVSIHYSYSHYISNFIAKSIAETIINNKLDICECIIHEDEYYIKYEKLDTTTLIAIEYLSRAYEKQKVDYQK